MDSFELNKIAGAVLGVLTFTLGLNVFSGLLFTTHSPETPGFVIEVPEAGAGSAQAAAPVVVPLPELLAAASVDKGANVAKKCGACHNFQEGAGAKVGPDLYGIVGRPFAHAEGFAYSAAMKSHGGTWNLEELDAFIKSPKQAIPGTSMGFAGLAKDTERADLLVYLNSLSHNPAPLPTAAPAPAEGAAPAPTEGAAPEAPAPADGAAPSDGAAPAAPAPAEDAAPAAPAAP